MVARVSERKTISPEDIDPRHDWKRPLGAPGVMNATTLFSVRPGPGHWVCLW